MAIFRNVNMSFWTDTKVADDYTPEDKYFMLYALTNNYTNIIGCYEVSMKQMSNDLGYNKDTIEKLINRFKEVHKTIDYDFDTKELIVYNWYKYNWSTSPKLDNPLFTAIENVKSDEFHDYLAKIYNSRESVNKEECDNEGNIKDRVLIPYRYGIDTTITITNTIPISIPITNTISNSTTNKSNDEEILKEEFNKLWKLYPKKVGKDKAFAKYKKYRTSQKEDYTTYEEVLSGLERYLKYIEQNRWYSPKDGSTWFNNKSWNDEYEIKGEKVPEWFDKEIEPVIATEEERKSIEELLREYR